MEKLKQILSQKKYLIPISGATALILIISLIAILTSKNKEETVANESAPVLEEDEDFDFTKTLAELDLSEDATFDQVYDKTKDLEESEDDFEDEAENSEALARFAAQKTNFYTDSSFNESEVAFPYSFFKDYTYRSAGFVEKTVKDYFLLTLKDSYITFVDDSLKDNKFNVKTSDGRTFVVALETSEKNNEKEVEKISILTETEKLLFSYDGRFYIEETMFVE